MPFENRNSGSGPLLERSLADQPEEEAVQADHDRHQHESGQQSDESQLEDVPRVRVMQPRAQLSRLTQESQYLILRTKSTALQTAQLCQPQARTAAEAK